MNGWVKIHRSILNWQWWPDDNMVRLWLHLIISANIEDQKWKDIVVKRGQLVTTISKLSEATNISTQGIRTCLNRLEESGEINKQTTNKYTIITVCKFDTYQIIDEAGNKQSNKQITNKQQTKQKFPPHPLQNINKNIRIYYYSSSPARTREEKQKQQFFFIFYLKGALNPTEEIENFLSWNTTPDRVVAWDKCPEYARYDTARRWRVKGAKMNGYSEKAGKVLTALVDAYIKRHSDFFKGIYNKGKYPCQLTEDNEGLTLYCSDTAVHQIEEDLALANSILRRFGIKKLFYAINQNYEQKQTL